VGPKAALRSQIENHQSIRGRAWQIGEGQAFAHCEAVKITSLPGVAMPPRDTASIAAVNKLIEALDEDDDVKEIFCNAEFSMDTPA
jgi:transcriptional/translational regulatory protein YebC/TACO1